MSLKYYFKKFFLNYVLKDIFEQYKKELKILKFCSYSEYYMNQEMFLEGKRSFKCMIVFCGVGEVFCRY